MQALGQTGPKSERGDGDQRGQTQGETYGFVLFAVPEHQPFSLNGHKSVTFTTMLGWVLGKKGGEAVYEFSKVSLKHFPQPGP